MQKIRNSGILKIICYMLIPILVAMIILSAVYLDMKDEFGYIENEDNSYIQTEEFGYNYLYNIVHEVYTIKYKTNEIYRYNQIDSKVYYSRESYDSNRIFNYINYVIVNNETGEIFTNVQFSNYEDFIETAKANDIYWIYEDENINTNVKAINNDNAKYMSLAISSGITTLEGYNIYTYVDKTAFEYSNTYAVKALIFDLFKDSSLSAEGMLLGCAILLVIIAIYLIWAIGHSKKSEGITLNALDRFPYELLLIIFFTIIGLCIACVETITYNSSLSINLMSSVIQIAYLGSYASLAIICVSTIKRLKAKEFWHSFFVYKIYKKLKDKMVNTLTKSLDNSSTEKAIIICYIAFLAITIILGVTFFTGISILLLIAFWAWTLYKILEYNKKLNEIKSALEEIYKGNNNIHIDTSNLKGILKDFAIYVNDIANGFTNAIEESLKSERLKTELITNVSHDIKTPLTSIINYVDLIKQENIEDEKIKEYVKVLDQKSQRLKKLTEDLIEASKASSGNVTLNIEDINLKELIKQVIGEFEDKFKESKLKIELNLPEEDVKIKADNRYMYRIIENLFSNISKYSMKNTRVYIDLKSASNQIKLEIKNVSKEKLNITADELTQRFVRGDKSRYTEGSGLGLSIAKSLTELQEGTFDIQIDGDLFKTILVWNVN